jgi:flap endonuclease-1
MGVHGLLPLLRKKAPSAFSSLDLQGNVAVDTPIFMYKFGYLVGTGLPLCRRMLEFANEIRARGLEPIFVFDGDNLPEKELERKRRKEANIRQAELHALQISQHLSDIFETEIEIDYTKPSCNPIKEDYDAVRMAFQSAGISTRQAKFEAEALCSFMVNQNEAVAVITEDSDCLAYMCSASILHWKSDHEIVVSAQKAMEELDLVPRQFLDLCVLLGNDFNDRIKNIGPIRSLALLKQQGSLENVIRWGKASNPHIRDTQDSEIQRMVKSQEIFQTFCFESTQQSTPDEGRE